MLFLGSHFMVGHLASFVLSYYPDSKKNEVHSLFPSITIVAIFSNFLGSNIVKARLLSPVIMITIASIVGIGGIYGSTYVKSW